MELSDGEVDFASTLIRTSWMSSLNVEWTALEVDVRLEVLNQRLDGHLSRVLWPAVAFLLLHRFGLHNPQCPFQLYSSVILYE